MSAFDYADHVSAVVALLRDQLHEAQIDVSDDSLDPTMDQCPAVRVREAGFQRTPRRIVNLRASASGFDERLLLRVRTGSILRATTW